jgi:hypothetical protein
LPADEQLVVLLAPGPAEVVGHKTYAPAPDQPRAVLDAVAQAPVEEAPAVGLGREHRLGGGALTGAALVVEGTVAHLMAFPAGAKDRRCGRSLPERVDQGRHGRPLGQHEEPTE